MNNYEEIYSKVHTYVSKLSKDKDIADDVSQEVFIKIHQSIDTLLDQEKMDSWLKRIVYTTLMDVFRKQKKSVSADFVLPEDMTFSDNEGNQALMDCISLLIRNLPDEQRLLLEEVELNGMSQTDYARHQNLPLSTVKSRIQRARKKLYDTVKSGCFIVNDKYGNVVDYRPPVK